MAINVEYGAGLMPALAALAGQAKAPPTQIQTNFAPLQQASRFGPSSMMRSAQGDAFALQNAMGNRMAKMKTPVVDHVSERLGMLHQQRAAQQKADKSQLDEMLSSGDIDQEAYDRAMLGVTSGNRSLMTQALKTPKPEKPEKPNLSNAEELDAIRHPFRERRQHAEKELDRLTQLGENKISRSLTPDIDNRIKKAQDTVDNLYADEQTAVNAWRTQGRGMYESPPAEPGTISMTVNATPTDQAIIDQAKQIAGPEAAPKIGSTYAGPVNTGPVVAPPTVKPPAGAKQAPDGEWYLPDPNRPGKYMKWSPNAPNASGQ
jgi:hypothetical protein